MKSWDLTRCDKGEKAVNVAGSQRQLAAPHHRHWSSPVREVNAVFATYLLSQGTATTAHCHGILGSTLCLGHLAVSNLPKAYYRSPLIAVVLNWRHFAPPFPTPCLSPRSRGHQAMSGGNFGLQTKISRREWGCYLPATSRQRPGLLLNILQDTGQPSTTKNDLAPNANSVTVKKPCLIITYKFYLPKSLNSTSFLLHSLLCPSVLQYNDRFMAAFVICSVKVHDQFLCEGYRKPRSWSHMAQMQMTFWQQLVNFGPVSLSLLSFLSIPI